MSYVYKEGELVRQVINPDTSRIVRIVRRCQHKELPGFDAMCGEVSVWGYDYEVRQLSVLELLAEQSE